jgi:hypothetical protein
MNMNLVQEEIRNKHYKKCYNKIYLYSGIYFAFLILFFLVVAGLKNEYLTPFESILYYLSLTAIGGCAIKTMFKINRYFRLVRF